MISVYQLKPAFQRVLTPVLEWLHARGVSANQLTVAGIVLSVGISACFFWAIHCVWLLLALPVGLLMRMALNALDGMMARRFKQCSLKGELLNEMGDVISDLLIYAPLMLFFSPAFWAVFAFVCLSVVNEMAGLMGKVVGKERRFDGPMGKSDRAFFVSVLAILLLCGLELSSVALWVFIAADCLLLLSTWLRCKRALHG